MVERSALGDDGADSIGKLCFPPASLSDYAIDPMLVSIPDHLSEQSKCALSYRWFFMAHEYSGQRMSR